MRLKFLHLEKARARLALSGALLSALFLGLLALGARSLIREKTFNDIDEELYTLAVALGSSFELEGLLESKRDTLRAGLEANAFEFRLANHSAILFKGDVPVAASGNLLKQALPGGIVPYKDRPEIPYTAVEPYSGQARTCRFLVTHLQQKARGSTLVLFRWIGPNLHTLGRLDRALAGFVILGFLGTAAILTGVVSRALKPVEEVTRLAERVEATDLSERVRVPKRGEEFRRLAAVINSLLERLESAFRAQKRLIADAAHELKTPTAVLVGEAQEAARPDASPEERNESLERSRGSPAASRTRWTACCIWRAATAPFPPSAATGPIWRRSRRRPWTRPSRSERPAASNASSRTTARPGFRGTGKV